LNFELTLTNLSGWPLLLETPGYSWNLLEMDLPPGKTPGKS